MKPIFNYALSRMRGGILGWGISIFLLGAMMVPVFNIMSEEAEQFKQLLDIYPAEMLAFFGDMAAMDTIEGFLSIEYFSFVPIILGIFMVSAGSGMLISDEENGTLDLVAAHPISRTGLFFGRFFALVAAILLILLIGFFGIYLPTKASEIPLDTLVLLVPFLSMFAFLLVIGTFALLMSMVLPSRRMASTFAGIVMVADFFIQGLSELNENLKPLANYLPFHYYQGGSWVDGLLVNHFYGLVGAALIFMIVSWGLFLRRDIRVGGEGSWELPTIGMLKRKLLGSPNS
ncbi:MAG: ABC transporter permease [Anaerolineae bacterium]|nr:ABC transporter permease [Anaerolineae bacterium]